MRIVIAGGPRTGKTTLANELAGERGQTAKHTDDLISLGWSEASQVCADDWLNAEGDWIVEGVSAPRALRKWLQANPEGKPCDVVHWLSVPHVELTKGQAAMAKGCLAVWIEVFTELRSRGVEIVLQ